MRNRGRTLADNNKGALTQNKRGFDQQQKGLSRTAPPTSPKRSSRQPLTRSPGARLGEEGSRSDSSKSRPSVAMRSAVSLSFAEGCVMYVTNRACARSDSAA
eukprot:3941931-Rhodomonas_salina.5